MTRLDIDHLEALGNAATGRNWISQRQAGQTDKHYYQNELVANGVSGEGQIAFTMRAVDADFCAAARNAWPAIIEALRDLERLRDVERDSDVLFGAEWRQAVKAVGGDPVAAQATQLAKLAAENERLRDALEDIECDYNINEGSEGIPITPSHKRCVDRAVSALRGE